MGVAVPEEGEETDAEVADGGGGAWHEAHAEPCGSIVFYAHMVRRRRGEMRWSRTRQ